MARRAPILTSLLLAGALGACAARTEPPPVLEQVPAQTLPPEPVELREAVQPVPVPAAFAAAVARGTRTRDGRPGPNYWQQRVDYQIDAELDPATATLQAEAAIVYRNNSPDTLRLLVLHLYQNAFAQETAERRGAALTSGVRLSRVAVGGRGAQRIMTGNAVPAGRPTYEVDGTLMRVHLARPLAPGGRLNLQIAWSFRVPAAPAPRMGQVDRKLFTVAQWYPQIAVYDDVSGWTAHPYDTRGEFYLELGDMQVSLTVPEGWLVAATGALQNAEEVLDDAALARLRRAAEEDGTARVVTLEDHEAGTATRRAPGGQLTWQFHARRVRDFAFATSASYLWDAVRVELPDADGDGAAERALVHAFYRPTAVRWREATEYLRHALRFNAELWGPYPYAQLSAAEGPVDGMEYPMLIFVRAFSQPYVLYGTLAHEVTHQWFPMLVGSDEAAHAWQDEGLATYAENLALRDFLPDTEPFDESLGIYLGIAGTRFEEPVAQHSSEFGSELSYAVAAYAKPASMLRVLAHVVGADTLHAALREYARRWHLRHPQPLDFFATVEEVTGRQLDWFWHPWWYTTATADYAIARVVRTPAGAGERVSITVEDQGEAPLPVTLVLTTVSGAQRSVRVPVDPWLRGLRRHVETVELPEPVVRVEIDPERVLPDVDRADNVWRRS